MLIDHTWVWRADHGVEGFTRLNGDTDRWHTNTGRNGVVVNGDDVTATGLFVEHFQQLQHGLERRATARTILYQNELPYDPPTQADWTHDGIEGWAGYKVGDRVRHAHAVRRRRLRLQPEQPVDPHRERLRGAATRPGVRLHHIMTVNLSAGTIDHVVNGVGDAADTTKIGAAGVRRRLPVSGQPTSRISSGATAPLAPAPAIRPRMRAT